MESRTRWIVGALIGLLAAGGGIVTLLDYIRQPSPQMSQLEIGTDRYGGEDFRDFPVSSVEECSDACLNDPDCRSFSFNVSAKQCWLKKDVPLRVENSGFTSGVKYLR